MYLIFVPLCQKMLWGETPPKGICVTILITHAPLLQLHSWLISFSPFKFISNDLYVAKLCQVWREVSSGVNCFRQWCAESYVWIDVIVIHLQSPFLSLCISLVLFPLLCVPDTREHTFPFCVFVTLSKLETKQEIPIPIEQTGFFRLTDQQPFPLFTCRPPPRQ